MLSRLSADLQDAPKPQPIFLGVDNNGAIETAKNTSVNQRNKDIDLHYHFLWDAYKSNLVNLRHVEPENQIADYLTKPLDRKLFAKLRDRQGLCSKPHSNSIGSRGIAENPKYIKLDNANTTSPENIDLWQPGIDREHDYLFRNETWQLVNYEPGMKVLPCKYVFKIKGKKPKDRLVALGCQKMYGVDYNESYSPVVALTMIRTILSVASSLDLELEQLDVVTTILSGKLHEDLYMSILQGLNSDSNKNKVWKLRKSLHGLEQPPHQCYAKIHVVVVTKLSLKSSQKNPCLYVRHTGSNTRIIALCVDDLLIAGNSKFEIAEIIRELSKRFEIKDLGPARVMLGIEIKRKRNEKQLFISQSEYSKEVLERFGMFDSKSFAILMDSLLEVKEKTCVATSTYESEHYAMCMAAKKLYRMLLWRQIFWTPKFPVRLHWV